jgi:ABC-2 type transport system permease protein
VVGNAVQASAMASIYGMTMGIANERWFGTLPSLLATPANRLALFCGRALPFVANGVLVSAFGFAVGLLLLDFRLAPSALPGLACVVVITVASCTGFGLLLGSIGLRARDVFFISNLFYFLMLLFCGVNVPLDALPGSLAAVGRALPLTHGIEAAREVAAGAPLRAVDHLIAQEALVGVAYGVAAYALLRLFEAEGCRRATLETM